MNLHTTKTTKDPHMVAVHEWVSICSCGQRGGYLQHFYDTHEGKTPYWCQSKREQTSNCKNLVDERGKYCEEHER